MSHSSSIVKSGAYSHTGNEGHEPRYMSTRQLRRPEARSFLHIDLGDFKVGRAVDILLMKVVPRCGPLGVSTDGVHVDQLLM